MKKLLMAAAVSLACITHAQTLEHSYNGDAMATTISPAEMVYYKWNPSAKKLEIYSGDHVLVKTITAQIPDAGTYIQYLSKTTFDGDDGYEFTVSSAGNSSFYVIDDNGSVKFTKAKGQANYLSGYVTNTSKGAKLMITYNKDAGNTTEVYALAGKLQLGKKEEDDGLHNELPYPNPAIEQIFIPNRENKIRFDVYNVSGTMVHSEIISGNFTYETKLLPSGIYYYNIGDAQAGKFVKE